MQWGHSTTRRRRHVVLSRQVSVTMYVPGTSPPKSTCCAMTSLTSRLNTSRPCMSVSVSTAGRR